MLHSPSGSSSLTGGQELPSYSWYSTGSAFTQSQTFRFSALASRRIGNSRMKRDLERNILSVIAIGLL
jgi:hypothetical protein